MRVYLDISACSVKLIFNSDPGSKQIKNALVTNDFFSYGGVIIVWIICVITLSWLPAAI